MKERHGFDFKDFGFPKPIKKTPTTDQAPNYRPNEKRPPTKIIGMWQKCGNRTAY